MVLVRRILPLLALAAVSAVFVWANVTGKIPLPHPLSALVPAVVLAYTVGVAVSGFCEDRCS